MRLDRYTASVLGFWASSAGWQQSENLFAGPSGEIDPAAWEALREGWNHGFCLHLLGRGSP